MCWFCLRGPEHWRKAERRRGMQQPGIKRSRLMALINARSILSPPLFLVSDACKNIHNIFVLCHNNFFFFFQMRVSFNKKWSATLLTYKVAADVAPAVDKQTLWCQWEGCVYGWINEHFPASELYKLEKNSRQEVWTEWFQWSEKMFWALRGCWIHLFKSPMV